MNSDVWLNGHLLGFHPYGYTSFAYDLTPYLNHDGENILAVRVRNEGQNSRWYSGSGIYRHVWLTFTEKVRLPLWGVSVTTPKVAPTSPPSKLPSKVENRDTESASVTVRARIIGPKGEVAGTGEQALDLPAAGESISTHIVRSRVIRNSGRTKHLISIAPKSSCLLREKLWTRPARLSVFAASKWTLSTGLRINGEVVKLKGGCVHHDNGILGSCAIDRAEERRVETDEGLRVQRHPHSAQSSFAGFSGCLRPLGNDGD